MLEVDAVNSKGGIKGRHLQVTRVDDQSSASTAIQQFRTLAADSDVLAIVGPCCTGQVLASKTIIESSAVPTFSAIQALEMGDPAPHWWFRMSAEADQSAIGPLDYFQKAGLTKIAILRADDGFGQTGEAALKAAALSRGITIVTTQTYPPDTTDPSIQVIKAKAANPDAYVVWDGLSGPRLGLVVKTLRAQGVTKTVVAPSSLKSFRDAAGPASDGVRYWAHVCFDEPKPGLQKEFVGSYKTANNGEVPDEPILSSHAAGEAIEKIRNMETVYNTVSYGPTNHVRPISALVGCINQNGKQVRAS
jgi:branched-chain amino acid transport system substrate-binding protein